MITDPIGRIRYHRRVRDHVTYFASLHPDNMWLLRRAFAPHLDHGAFFTTEITSKVMEQYNTLDEVRAALALICKPRE